jgi:hypothetical protein
MNFIDDAMKLATMPVPGPAAPDEHARAFAQMSIVELAGLWCSLQYVGLKEQSEESWAALLYFDQLPHEQPERAFALVLAVLRSEAHKSVLLELNAKLFTVLIHKHASRLIDEIEREAQGDARLRWLLGGVVWWAPNEGLRERILALADQDGWRHDRDARDAAEPIDFAKLSTDELARVWIDQNTKPHKDHDDNWMALQDYERELVADNPDAAIDLIVAILEVETDERVLGFLAAGLLENVISMRSIDRIEREAATNEKFRWLLGGVWYWSEPDELKARLDAVLMGQHWAN